MSGNLPTKQQKAIQALIDGQSYEEAALTAGVTSRTLRKWRCEDEEFQQEITRQSNIVLSDATTNMKSNMQTAVSVICEVMNDTAAPPAVRVRAAQVMLETGLKLVEAAEVLNRITALEKVYYEAQHGQGIKAT